jgi:hypothetical protein
MSNRAGTLGAVAAVGLLVLAFAASPAAWAVDIIESQAPGGKAETAAAGWQAGTCSTDPCSAEMPGLFFTQAAGHPPDGFTQIIVKHAPPGETPVGDLRTVRVDLPTGLSVNPQATPQCTLAAGQSPATCPPATAVGTSAVTAAAVEVLGLPLGTAVTLPPVPVYNIEPRDGEPARFGFSVAGSDVFLDAGVAWQSDYHEFFTIHVAKLELPIGPLNSLAPVRLLKNRLVFAGATGLGGAGGPFLTGPSTCFDPTQASFAHTYSTYLHADSYQEEAPQFPTGSQELEAPLPQGVMPSGCEKVPFAPSVGGSAGTNRTDSPDGPTVEVGIPFDPGAAIANSNLRTARVALPFGLGLNPSAAPGLKACSDGQFGKGTTNPVACPKESEIGTVAIQTPVLPAGSLSGKVYLGQQLSRNPASGQEYRVFIDAEAPRYGQSVRLLGNVSANPSTGQLTTVVSEAPQLPFTSVKIQFDGAKGTLTSPPICGPHVTTAKMTPWSGGADVSPADKGFVLSAAPGGGPCAKTMAARPFSPDFAAGPKSDQAAAFTPFLAQISRNDGQQELKGVDVTLPPGATAKLAGVPYCPPAALAAAANRAGAAEKADSSCPDKSQVGVVSVAAGSGASPLRIAGKAFLTGPYRGAPLSLAVVTPALAGPFDLGNVVVRVRLLPDPESAQIHAVSDPIPDVFGGAKLGIRSIAVNVNREQFTLNGTNCSKFATAGALRGGGADPTNPAAFSAFPVSAPFQAAGCKPLRFRPKLNLRLFGATRRAKNPRLRAVLKARPGDANIARASVALPHALFLDQASLGTVCTRVQFSAGACPKRSVYGHARALTPLLDRPLEGPVYLRSSSNTLPDLVAHLQGQVDIDLVGRVDSFRGGIRTTFAHVPDVPVSKFTLILPGGKHGLLEASRNLCARPVKAIVQLKGQNDKKVNKRPKLRTPCQGKRAGGPKRRGHPGNGKGK